jgi:hypothetical protein
LKHSHTQVARLVALGAYVFGLTLILGPVINLITTVLPVRVGDVTWRYGSLGMAAGYLNTPLLGLGLAIAVAIWQEDLAVLRALGIVATVAAVLLLPVMAMWTLDVLQMRELSEPEVRAGVLIGGVIQGAKYFGACAVLGLVGLGISRTVKGTRSASHSEDGPGSPGSLRGD